MLTEARCTDACCVSRTACVRLMQGRSSFLFTGNTSPSHVTTSSMMALLSAFALCLHRDRGLVFWRPSCVIPWLHTKAQAWLLAVKTQEKGLGSQQSSMGGAAHRLLMSLTLLLPALVACSVALPGLSRFCPTVTQCPMMTFRRASLQLSAVQCHSCLQGPFCMHQWHFRS